jgi:transcriptional regulator with XRE-family HTH domain
VGDADVAITGPVLRRLREILGLPQAAVAREVGFNAAWLCRIEAGQVPLSAATAARIRRGIVDALEARAIRFLAASVTHDLITDAVKVPSRASASAGRR